MQCKASKVILLTAFRGEKSTLFKSIKININQLKSQDIWIIVLDNLDFDKKSFKEFDKNIILLNYSGQLTVMII